MAATNHPAPDAKKRRAKYATGDDRFTFPPLPGYTGYIPRSQEHFAKPYMVTTSAALADFQHLRESREKLPARLLYVNNHPEEFTASGRSQSRSSSSAQKCCKQPIKRGRHEPVGEHNYQSFISGYTGFIPHLRNRFGQQYQLSATEAMEEFCVDTLRQEVDMEDDGYSYSTVDGHLLGEKAQSVYTDTTTSASKRLSNAQIRSIDAIPGYTGFIPLAKYTYSQTYGNAIHNRTNQSASIDEDRLPKKDLSQTLPIPGYKGFLPLYQMTGEKSYSQTSKQCINTYKAMCREQN